MNIIRIFNNRIRHSTLLPIVVRRNISFSNFFHAQAPYDPQIFLDNYITNWSDWPYNYSSYFPWAFQYFLEKFHDIGFSWITVVPISAFIIRSLFLPITIISKKNLIRKNNIQPLTDSLKKKFNNLSKTEQQKKFMKLLKKYNISMTASFLPILQIPIITSAFVCLRYLPERIPSLHTSFLWIPDIAQRDPYFILPLLVGFTAFKILQNPLKTAKFGQNMPGWGLNILKVSAMSFSLLFFSYQHVVLSSFMLATNLNFLITNYLLEKPKIKKIFGIPDEKLIYEEIIPINIPSKIIPIPTSRPKTRKPKR